MHRLHPNAPRLLIANKADKAEVISLAEVCFLGLPLTAFTNLSSRYQHYGLSQAAVVGYAREAKFQGKSMPSYLEARNVPSVYNFSLALILSFFFS
jgi:hypothetical protein